MKRIVLVILMILLVGCSQGNTMPQSEQWYMIVNTTVKDSEYSPFLDEDAMKNSLLEEVRNTEGVEDIQPIYNFDTRLTEPGKWDQTHGNVKVYKNDEFVEEYHFGDSNEAIPTFHLLNLWGYPEGIDMNNLSSSFNESIENGCYLSDNAAKQLGIKLDDNKYTLEIYCLIPATNIPDFELKKQHPELVQDATNRRQFLYPYTLKIDVAGVLSGKISSAQGQIYIPLELMQGLVKEHQVEEIRTKNYIIKVKNKLAVNRVEKLSNHLKVLEYPLKD